VTGAQGQKRVARSGAWMDSADRGTDAQTLLDPVDAAVEIGDSKQEVIDGRD
jgi:hypothetical protein